jgi:hypothetical protein
VTWTLSAPIAADKLLLTLPGTITDTSANPMGNPYTVRFNVHPGDANIDAAVNRSDLVRNLLNQFTTPNLSQYDPLQDIDTNGRINILDWMRIRDRFGTSLPPGEPGPSPSAPEAAIAIHSPARRTATRIIATDAAFETPAHLSKGEPKVAANKTILRSNGRQRPATDSTVPAREAVGEPLRARRQRVVPGGSSSESHDAVFAQL